MKHEDQEIDPLLAMNILGLPPLVPWWLTHIKFFVGIRIWPCESSDEPHNGLAVRRFGSRFVQMCKPEEANVWTVFGLYWLHDAKDREIRLIIDALINFETESKAQEFCERLLRTYPHLGGENSKIIKTSDIEDGIYLVAHK